MLQLLVHVLRSDGWSTKNLNLFLDAVLGVFARWRIDQEYKDRIDLFQIRRVLKKHSKNKSKRSIWVKHPEPIYLFLWGTSKLFRTTGTYCSSTCLLLLLTSNSLLFIASQRRAATHKSFDDAVRLVSDRKISSLYIKLGIYRQPKPSLVRALYTCWRHLPSYWQYSERTERFGNECKWWTSQGSGGSPRRRYYLWQDRERGYSMQRSLLWWQGVGLSR